MTEEQQKILAEALRRSTLLTTQEWRTVHNALAVYQCSFREIQKRRELQLIMDKIRDNFIAQHE